MAAKKGAKKGSKRRAKPGPKPGEPSKSDFIRNLPREMPAKDVVAKGKEQGMTLTVPYVYAVRSASRSTTAKKTKDAALASPGRRGGRPRKGGATSDSHVKEILRAAIAAAGIDGAGPLLDEARRRLDLIA